MGEERKLEGRDEGDWQCSSSSHSHWPEEEQILALAPCSRSARSGPEDVRVLMKTSGCEERRILGSQVQGQEGFWRGRVSFGRSRDVMARGRGGGGWLFGWLGALRNRQCALSPPSRCSHYFTTSVRSFAKPLAHSWPFFCPIVQKVVRD